MAQVLQVYVHRIFQFFNVSARVMLNGYLVQVPTEYNISNNHGWKSCNKQGYVYVYRVAFESLNVLKWQFFKKKNCSRSKKLKKKTQKNHIE